MKTYFNPYKQFTGVFIPDWLLEFDQCSLPSKMLYAVLARFAGKDGFCYPSQDKLSTKMGVSKRSVQRYLEELIDAEIIECRQVGKRSNNRYYFVYREDVMKQEVKPEKCVDKLAHHPEVGGQSVHSDTTDLSTGDTTDLSTPIVKRISKKENQLKSTGDSFSKRLDEATTKKQLLDIWIRYRRSKGKHPNLHEQDVLMNKEWRDKSVDQIKAAITYTVANGWMSIQYPRADKTEIEDKRFIPNYL